MSDSDEFSATHLLVEQPVVPLARRRVDGCPLTSVVVGLEVAVELVRATEREKHIDVSVGVACERRRDDTVAADEQVLEAEHLAVEVRRSCPRG